MKAKFDKLKKIYDEYYATLYLRGKAPIGSTNGGYWGASAADDVLEIFKKINLKQKKSIVDLGSGDGKVTLVASLFTNSIGIESDKDMIETSEVIKEELGAKNVVFHNSDYLDIDLGEFDVVFINPDKPFYELEKKLRNELKGILIVYDNLYTPLNMKKIDSFFVNGVSVGIYGN